MENAVYTADMRYLGLDVGDRRIGIALSDETGTLASPIETYERTGPRKDLKAIGRLVRERGAGEVVVGLPRRLDGEVGPQAQKVIDFMEALRPVVGVPVVPWDERFTTVVARQALVDAGVSRRDRKAVIDKVSAALILQNYLDYLKLAGSEAPNPSA